MEPIHVSAR